MTFWIVTPHTGQRTALEKDSDSDTRAIINSIALDIKNEAGTRLVFGLKSGGYQEKRL